MPDEHVQGETRQPDLDQLPQSPKMGGPRRGKENARRHRHPSAGLKSCNQLKLIEADSNDCPAYFSVKHIQVYENQRDSFSDSRSRHSILHDFVPIIIW